MNTLRALINLIDIALFDTQNKYDFSNTDFNKVYIMATKHSVANIVALGIKKSDVNIPEEIAEKFEKQINKAVLRFIRQTHAVNAITEAFEYAEIPHAVLKDSRIATMYPDPQMRASCDIDIYYDCDNKKAASIMNNLGYPCSPITPYSMEFNQFDLIKIELQKRLFSEEYSFSNYFKSVKDRLVSVTDKRFELSLTNEDFYIYLIATIAKSFIRYGSGIRSILDICIFNRNLPDGFDREKTDAILRSIGLFDFEERIRVLSEKWFSTVPLSESDKKLTRYIASAGIYDMKMINAGKTSNVSHASGFNGRMKRTFPSYSFICKNYDHLIGRPLLLPAYWVAYWLEQSTHNKAHGFTDSHILPCKGLNTFDNNCSPRLADKK